MRKHSIDFDRLANKFDSSNTAIVTHIEKLIEHMENVKDGDTMCESEQSQLSIDDSITVSHDSQSSKRRRIAASETARASPNAFRRWNDIDILYSALLRADRRGLPLFEGILFVIPKSKSTDSVEHMNSQLCRNTIINGGGQIVEECQDIDSRTGVVPLLLSDSHHRSHTYLLAMAQGIKCLKRDWILACDEIKALIDFKDFLLPSGVSILDHQLHNVSPDLRTLLAGKIVLLPSMNDPTLTKTQKLLYLINCLGGMAIDDTPNNRKIDYMLSDSSAQLHLMGKARSLGAAIVTSAWLIEGVITGKLPKADAHPNFFITTQVASNFLEED